MALSASRAALANYRRGRRRVEANARLTGGLAAILLVLLAAEGATLVGIHQLLTVHVVIGFILVPPVCLKISSTTWRFTRYYLGDPAYRRKGPPAPLLRLLGPIVIGLTTILLASGILLVFYPGGSFGGSLLFVHQASFVLWFGAMAIHVLGHLVDTGRLAPQDWLTRTRRAVPGATARIGLLGISLVVGIILATSLSGRASTYWQRHYGTPPAAAARSGH